MIFLKTDRLQLTNLRRSDTAALVAIRQDPDCARYQRWSDTTPDAIDAYIARHALDQFLSRAEEQHYALRTPDGALAGELSYFDNPKDCCITLGITVALTDGRSFPATVVGSDYLTDLAVLYISAEDLTPAKLGDSSALQEGEKVAGLGSSLALSGTVGGTVSDVSREITFEGRTMVMIQTNLVLPEGSAGSPLLNSSGQVVGINALQTDTNSTDADPGCFAIPSVTVKEVTQELIRQGYVSGRPSLGFSTHTLSALEQQFFRLPKGVYITRVDSDSPAYQVGIRPGDTLLQVNGQAITTTQELMSLVYTLSPGDRAEVVFYRSGWRYTANILVIENQGN